MTTLPFNARILFLSADPAFVRAPLGEAALHTAGQEWLFGVPTLPSPETAATLVSEGGASIVTLTGDASGYDDEPSRATGSTATAPPAAAATAAAVGVGAETSTVTCLCAKRMPAALKARMILS